MEGEEKREKKREAREKESERDLHLLLSGIPDTDMPMDRGSCAPDMLTSPTGTRLPVQSKQAAALEEEEEEEEKEEGRGRGAARGGRQLINVRRHGSAEEDEIWGCSR